MTPLGQNLCAASVAAPTAPRKTSDVLTIDSDLDSESPSSGNLSRMRCFVVRLLGDGERERDREREDEGEGERRRERLRRRRWGEGEEEEERGEREGEEEGEW